MWIMCDRKVFVVRRALALAGLLAALTVVVAACSAAGLPPLGAQGTPATSAGPTAIAPIAASPLPTPDVAALARVVDTCALLNSQDFAHLLTTSELQRVPHAPTQVDHAIFSAGSSPVKEFSCIYYAYHQPGSASMVMLQTTYWVDVPVNPADAAWAQVWQAEGAGALDGIPDAVYQNGRLTFRHHGAYVTIEVLGNRFDPATPAGTRQQTDYEQQLAQDALARLP
jgi:hypothetical protein